jgi:hypothetical protein
MTVSQKVGDFMFGLSANGVMAFTSVVNVSIVCILAVFNYRYMKSAAEQALAAREQAQAASENIKLTREQIEQQRSLKLVEALVDFRRMQGLINWWMLRLEESGAIGSFPELLPNNWPNMFQIVEQSTSAKDQLLTIESHLRNAEMLVADQLARSRDYRDSKVFKAAAGDLSDADRALKEVLERLEFAFPERS